MITELAILNVKPGMNSAFESAVNKAGTIISSMPGYQDHEVLKCIEEENKYMLRVLWESLEAHTEGFRKSEQYQDWKKLLHHYYDPFPIVEHYQSI